MRRTATHLALMLLMLGAMSGSLGGTAAATTITASPSGAIAATAGPLLINSTGGNISCTASFTGTLNATIAATPGATIGTMTGGTLSGCSSTGLATGPFTSLITPGNPTIITHAALLFVGGRFIGELVVRSGYTLSFSYNGRTCLYRGNIGFLDTYVYLTPDIAYGRFAALPGQTLTLIAGTGCPASVDMSGAVWSYSTLHSIIIR